MKTKNNLKNVTKHIKSFVYLTIIGLSISSCEQLFDMYNFDMYNYEAGKIPGLGNNPGQAPGYTFTLPEGVVLYENITGGGSSGNYWNHPLGSDGVHYFGSGSGYVDLKIPLRNTRSYQINVTFPAATILVARTGVSQNGVLLKEVTVTIPANSNYLLCLSFYCGNKNKSAAGSGNIYDLGVVSNAYPLVDLCNRVKYKRINIEMFAPMSTIDKNAYNSQIGTLQSIVWRVTDGNGLTQSDIDFISSLPLSF
ncbi:MAG: hypothetical protein LBC84_07435 [Prevotellaceae bacterium]|jgi:hypothetical protein|nr:hypothetical protein [Prevotellaceae bacterium]